MEWGRVLLLVSCEQHVEQRMVGISNVMLV